MGRSGRFEVFAGFFVVVILPSCSDDWFRGQLPADTQQYANNVLSEAGGRRLELAGAQDVYRITVADNNAGPILARYEKWGGRLQASSTFLFDDKRTTIEMPVVGSQVLWRCLDSVSSLLGNSGSLDLETRDATRWIFESIVGDRYRAVLVVGDHAWLRECARPILLGAGVPPVVLNGASRILRVR